MASMETLNAIYRDGHLMPFGTALRCTILQSGCKRGIGRIAGWGTSFQ